MNKTKSNVSSNSTLPGVNDTVDFMMYTTPDGKVRVEAFIRDENIWLTQDKMATLFGVERSVITKHLKNIFSSNELQEDSTSAKIALVQNEGNRKVLRNVKFYNLDAIISVGYRVNSIQATHFRIWATARLKEYIIKGFTMDDERLKNPNHVFGRDYFEEQLARVRDIRSSERRFYQKITDIYAQCSADYSNNSEETKLFFATVQNKLHWAISQQTAAEIIYSRADSNKEHMGLTSWKNAPVGKIRKGDVSIAKNYLTDRELDRLNRIVSMYLDFAELQATQGKVMLMKDWISRLDAFLKFNEREILQDFGKVTQEIAKAFAENELEKYRAIEDATLQSDFDKLMEELPGIKGIVK